MRRCGLCVIAIFLSIAVLAKSDAQTASAAPTRATSLPWGKPLKGGTLRVAAVYPADGEPDLAALEAAFDLRLARFPFSGDPSDALMHALKEKADVLVCSSIAAAKLDDTLQSELAGRVKSGTGLVWVAYSTAGRAELAEAMTSAGIPPVDPAPNFSARAGGGALTGLQPGLDQAFAYARDAARAVEVQYWKPRPRGQALVPLAAGDALNQPIVYENYIAIACEALRWAARREPEAMISSIDDASPAGPSDVDTPPQLPGSYVKRLREAAQPGVLRQMKLTLAAPALRAYSLRVQARYAQQPIRWSFNAEERVAKGAQEIVLNVPAGAGACFVDVWLMDGLRVVDWFTQAFDLPAAPELGEVSFGNTAVGANDRLRLTADVHKDLLRGDLRRPQPATLYWRVTDALGRVVASKDIELANTGAEITQELPLVDLISPYARAELFATRVTETPLSWWIREHGAYRRAHLSVQLPPPAGLALIVDDAGEGSFIASKRRQKLTAAGVDYVYPSPEADLGNVAADGLRMIGRLGELGSIAGEKDARARGVVAVRQAAARYAAARPGLYIGESNDTSEENRAAIERVVRETDPKARVGLLSGDVTPPDAMEFAVTAPEYAALESASGANFLIVHTGLSADMNSARPRWLPWLSAMYGANALWISPDDSANDDIVEGVLAETARVREGYDMLLRHASVAPREDDPSLETPKKFVGIARRLTFGSGTVYALLADPEGPKGSFKVRAEKDEERVFVPTEAVPPAGARGASIKLQPGDAAIAVVLPYEVTRIAIDAPGGVMVGKRLLVRAQVKTRGALPGDHVLRLTCFGPRGEALPHYGRTAFAPAGAATFAVPLAFNDAPGVYRLVVHDVLTGVASEATVSVLESKESKPAVGAH